jgi:cellulose synthase/poly-beta-1,6-N-acetylglucosamine synthase-like glycosyltransferase
LGFPDTLSISPSWLYHSLHKFLFDILPDYLQILIWLATELLTGGHHCNQYEASYSPNSSSMADSWATAVGLVWIGARGRLASSTSANWLKNVVRHLKR